MSSAASPMVPAALTAASSESKRSTARVTIAPAVAASVTLPVTGRVGLYTSVMLTPLRPVAVVASQAATVDQLLAAGCSSSLGTG
jgi:alkanesulfonate monooxygenase SsuD/methylene tetrahydromethanopterin reductase-like flavin-dependent oxidoreductase (luciferase family)